MKYGKVCLWRDLLNYQTELFKVNNFGKFTRHWWKFPLILLIPSQNNIFNKKSSIKKWQ